MPLATGDAVMVYNRGLGKGRSVRPPLQFPAPRTMQISLTPDYSLLAIMVIFIINYFVVSKFFIKPINAVLESSAASEERETIKRESEALARLAAERILGRAV